MTFADLLTSANSLISLALLAVTGVYAWLTFRLVKAAEEQSWETSRARVVVKIATNQGGGLFLLHIENSGRSSAYNLKIAIDRPLHADLGQKEDIRNRPFFTEGLRSFPPDTKIRFALGVTFQYLNDAKDRLKHPSSFKVSAMYQTGGREIHEEFLIDIREQYWMSSRDTDYIEEFSRKFPDKFEKNIRELKRSIDQIKESDPELPIHRRSWGAWFSELRANRRRWGEWEP